MTQQEKQQAIDLLRNMVSKQATQIVNIEPRLMQYYEHLCQFSGIELGDPNDLHNGNELLCSVKLLRLLKTYPLNIDKIKFSRPVAAKRDRYERRQGYHHRKGAR